MLFLQNKNISGILVKYLDQPQWPCSKIWNLISCGHLIEHLVGKNPENQLYCGQRCSSSLEPCSHARGHLHGRTQPPLPRPEPWDMEEKRKNPPRTPSLLPLLSARCRPAWPRQRRPTEPRHQDRTPPARVQGRSARCCPSHVARAPAPATFWPPSPPTSWPIKAPSEHTNEHAPLPASSQTSSFPPVLFRLTSPAPPASYWTWVAPPRSASVEQGDAGKWRRRAAGVFFAPRRQALLPLCRASPSNTRPCNAGELQP
jgi:hypothetical protein